jgi:hypothetical protein
MIRCAGETLAAVDRAMDDVAFHKALAAVIELVTKANELRAGMQPVGAGEGPGEAGAPGDGPLQRARGGADLAC